MTTDDLQLLREFRAEIPAPDDETRRRIYAHATNPAPSRWHDASRRLSVPPLRLRFALPAVAAVCAAAVAAVVLTATLGGGNTVSHGKPSNAVFPWFSMNVNRSGQAVSSVDATVRAPWPDATAQISVVRNPDFEQQQFVNGKLVSGPGGQIVFQTQTSLTNLTSNPKPLPADDRWSSTVTLDPSQWDGGCQNAPYAIVVFTDHPSDPKNSAQSGSWFFTCNPGA